MDPFATADVKKRRRKREFLPIPWEDHHSKLRKDCEFKIRYLEKLLPTISEPWFYDIVTTIKKHLEYIIKLIDSLKETVYLMNDLMIKDRLDFRIGIGDFDSKLQKKFRMYRKKMNDLEKQMSSEFCLYHKYLEYPLSRGPMDYSTSTSSLAVHYLENLLPTISEQWFYNFILRMCELLNIKIEKEIEINKKKKLDAIPLESYEEHGSIFKVIVFGDNGVGKESFIRRCARDFRWVFPPDMRKTIGAVLKVKIVEINDKILKLHLWGLEGAERLEFRLQLPTYIRVTDGAIFIYDVTNYSSLAHFDDWLKFIRKVGMSNKKAGYKRLRYKLRKYGWTEDEIDSIKHPNKSKWDILTVPIIVVGNKADLQDDRVVTSEDGIKFAKSRGAAGFIECSAKTGEHVEEVIDALTHLMMKRFT